MTGDYPIRCACGALTGTLNHTAWVNRVVCYCKDCQAFAERLGKADEVLDGQGGSDIVQTGPRYVSFEQGSLEHLACLRLTPAGLLRWYAACCHTPVCNTPPNWKFSFVGLLHSCLGDGAHLDAAFGPPRMHVFTQSARGEPKPQRQMPVTATARLGWKVAWARLGGGYRQTPFFDASGVPVATPMLAAAQAGDPR